MENKIMERINEIAEEYAQLPQMKDYELTLEAVGEDGSVKVTLHREWEKPDADKIAFHTYEKTFAPTDSLEHVRDTFGYSEYLTPLSCDIALEGLKSAYFDEYLNRVVVERDNSTEEFKVKSPQKERMMEILRERLGAKFES